MILGMALFDIMAHLANEKLSEMSRRPIAVIMVVKVIMIASNKCVQCFDAVYQSMTR